MPRVATALSRLPVHRISCVVRRPEVSRSCVGSSCCFTVGHGKPTPARGPPTTGPFRGPSLRCRVRKLCDGGNGRKRRCHGDRRCDGGRWFDRERRWRRFERVPTEHVSNDDYLLPGCCTGPADRSLRLRREHGDLGVPRKPRSGIFNIRVPRHHRQRRRNWREQRFRRRRRDRREPRFRGGRRRCGRDWRLRWALRSPVEGGNAGVGWRAVDRSVIYRVVGNGVYPAYPPDSRACAMGRFRGGASHS
jgi:hypothetical protein